MHKCLDPDFVLGFDHKADERITRRCGKPSASSCSEDPALFFPCERWEGSIPAMAGRQRLGAAPWLHPSCGNSTIGLHLSTISICMVSLNAWEVLKACLDSLGLSAPGNEYEIVVVDNASSDGTPERLRAEFPNVRLICNDRNVGFTHANNQAIAASKGDFLLWLNTDTILRPDTISALVHFLETHSRAGIVGPKVLNPNGTFQPQCRRGLPTPLASLFYMLGLDRFFPGCRLAGRYLLSSCPSIGPIKWTPFQAVACWPGARS